MEGLFAAEGRIRQNAPVFPAVAGHSRLKGNTSGPSGTELIGLGVFLAAAFVVPLVLGLALDAAVHTSPLFLFIGAIVGIAAATAGLYARLKRYL